jgi:hypothetical protein
VTANLKQLIAAARLLHPLLDELVFVGGSVTGLLITDEGAAEPRTTLDVDAIVEITSYAQYAAFGDRLRALGFAEDTTEDAPHQHRARSFRRACACVASLHAQFLSGLLLFD